MIFKNLKIKHNGDVFHVNGRRVGSSLFFQEIKTQEKLPVNKESSYFLTTSYDFLSEVNNTLDKALM